MRSRIIAGVISLVAVAGLATLSARADCGVTSSKQWTIVSFANPVVVAGRYVMGNVLIVHDSEKMAKGEPCTSFYRFDPKTGQQERLVAFHCKPRQAAVSQTTRLSIASTDPGCQRLVEYQIAGDTEAHGVPLQ